MTTEIVKVDPKQFGIEEQQAVNLTAGLKPYIDERKSLIDEFEKIKDLPLTQENIPTFKALRLKFRDNRTKGINKWHETTKQVPLRMGQLIDAIKRAENQINETHEEFLEKGEKHFELLEQQRTEQLQKNRAEQLSKYVEDAHERRLSDMDDDVWNAYLSTKKKEHEDRIEAEKQAELDRIAKEKAEKLHKERREKILPYWDYVEDKQHVYDLSILSDEVFDKLLKSGKDRKTEYEAKQERIRLDNERLKKEAEAKEKELEKERLKAKAEADKLKAENDAKLKKEQEAKAKLEAELKAKKDAEIKAENERKASELKAKAEAEKLAKAPIKNQLNAWVDSFDIPLSNIDHYKKGIIVEKFKAFKTWAKNEIESI